MPPRFFGWICDHREEFIGGEEMTIEESSTAFNKVFSVNLKPVESATYGVFIRDLIFRAIFGKFLHVGKKVFENVQR